MRMLARIMAGLFGVLLVAAVGGAWALPRIVDWHAYRGEIERIATESLGREVRLSGDFDFSLLPEPELSVRGLSMADSGDGFALAAPELRMSVGLWPLVVGRVQVNELTIAGAEIRLRPSAHVLHAGAVVTPRWLRRARLRLADARIHVGALTAEKVQARVMAGGPRGPWSAEGLAQIANRGVSFKAGIGQVGRDGSATIDLLLGQASGTLTVGGIVNLATGSVLGRAVAATADLGSHLPAPRIPLRAEGRISGGPDAVSVDDIAGELGGTPISGALSVRLSPELRIDLAAAANTIALDPWVEAFGAATASFTGPPVAIDLSAEGASLWSGSIRRPRLSIVLADGQIAINEAEALLPGGTKLTASGVVTPTAEGPRFEGLGEVSGTSLRSTLDWLGLSTQQVPVLSLRAVELQGRVTADRREVNLFELDGRVDSTRLTGRMGVQSGGKPSVDAELNLDRLSLAEMIGDEPPDWTAIGRDLAALSARIRLNVGRLELARTTLRSVELATTLDRGQVAVPRLAFLGAGGLAVTARGAGSLGGRIVLGECLVEASLQDGAELLGEIDLGLGVPAEMAAGPGTFRLALSGPMEQLAVDLGLEAAGGRIEAKGALSVPGERYEGSLALQHPSAVRLIRSLGWGNHRGWIGEGSLGAIGRVVLRPDSVQSENGVRLGLGGLRAVVDGRVERGADWRIGLRVAAERLPLPDAMPDPAALADALADIEGSVSVRAAEVVRAEDVLVTDLEATMGFEGDGISVRGVKAGLWSGRLEAEGRYVPAHATAPRLHLRGTLADATLTRALTGSAVDLSGARLGLLGFDLASTGHGPEGLVAALSGTGSVSAADGVLLGFDLRAAQAALVAPGDKMPAVVQAMSAGGTAFERLQASFRIGAGLVEIEGGELAAGTARAVLGGAVSLPGRALDLTVSAVLEPGLEPVAVRITGPASAPRSVVETAGLERSIGAIPP